MACSAPHAHDLPIRRSIGVFALVVGILLGSLAASPAQGQDAAPAVQPPQSDAAADETAARHDALSKLLSGSTLQGHFTVDGQDTGLKEERYEIQSVTKLPAGDLWLFKVRIRYGDHDVNVPLPLTINWAGKTPMIVVDQLTIPGLGTFDSRVVIADRRYSGTWQHGDVGGHLFGNIVPTAKPEKDEPDKDEPPSEEGSTSP